MLPDGRKAEPPVSVLRTSSEDDRHVLVVNRLIAAGADLTRIANLSMVDGAPFWLPERAGALRRGIDERPGCRLAVLDQLAGLAPFPPTPGRGVR